MNAKKPRSFSDLGPSSLRLTSGVHELLSVPMNKVTQMRKKLPNDAQVSGEQSAPHGPLVLVFIPHHMMGIMFSHKMSVHYMLNAK